MKKNTTFLSLIALLLALLLTLTACDLQSLLNKNTAEDTEAETTKPEKEFNAPDAVETNVNYTSLLNKWTQYMEYVTPTVPNSLSAQHVVSTENLYDYEETNGFLVTEIRRENKRTLTPEGNPTVVSVNVDMAIYDKVGGQLQSLHSLLPAVSGGKFLDREILPSRYVYYTINAQLASGLGGIYEVVKTVWVLNEDAAAEPEATDPEAYLFEVANYQTVSTYSYYRADGTAIYEDLDVRAQVSNPANSAAIGKRFLIDIADKTLLVDNEGNLIKAFNLGREYDIPVFDENSVDSTDGYAFFAQGDYYYTVSEATPQYTPVGELYMYVVPGMTIEVMDKEYNTLAAYTARCYHVSGYAILPNGNIYVCEYIQLPGDAETFDIQIGEEKFDIVNKIIDIETKSEKTVDVSFVAQKLFNNTTKSIKTFTNMATLNSTSLSSQSSLYSCNIKDGYMLAEIQNFAEGSLDTKASFVVLDSNLNVVENLPSIIPNQLGYASFIDASTLLVSTRSAGEKLVNYTIDTASGKANLFAHDYTVVKKINDGYYFNGCVYDAKWEKLCDLSESDYTLEAIRDGKLYLSSSYGENRALYVGYISSTWDNSSRFDTSMVCDEFLSFHGGYVKCLRQELVLIRNTNGSILLTGEASEYPVSKVASNGATVYYDKLTTIDSIEPTGNLTYWVTMKVTLTKTSQYVEGDDLPSTYTYNVYYIVK